MSLLNKIEEDLIKSLKERDVTRLGVLRMVKTAFKNKEIEKRGKGEKEDLSNEEILALLNREVKKRREAMDLYSKGNRSDLFNKEFLELKILEEYLPKMLDEKEISVIVQKVLQNDDFTPKEFGLVMKKVMAEVKGRADGSIVSKIIKEKLK